MAKLAEIEKNPDVGRMEKKKKSSMVKIRVRNRRKYREEKGTREKGHERRRNIL